MAHKKGAGSTKNGRDSNAKRLGVKIVGGSYIKTGQIIVRQRGCTFKAGANVGVGRDYTLYALTDGYVSYDVTNSKNKKIVITTESWGELINNLGYSNWDKFYTFQMFKDFSLFFPF